MSQVTIFFEATVHSVTQDFSQTCVHKYTVVKVYSTTQVHHRLCTFSNQSIMDSVIMKVYCNIQWEEGENYVTICSIAETPYNKASFKVSQFIILLETLKKLQYTMLHNISVKPVFQW